MARELSQAELLDFLCAAGGRATNAALLGHFARLLRDPAAPPAELHSRRQRFKGFVNAVATVRQDAPGQPKLVVLRRRFRELVEDAPQPPPGDPPARGPRPPPGPCPSGPPARARDPRLPPCPSGPPARARDPRLPPCPSGPPAPLPHCARAPPPSCRPCPPCKDTPQQRVREWLEKASPPPSLGDDPLSHPQVESWPSQPSPPSSSWSTCPSPSLDSQLGRFPATARGTLPEQVPVFRSIRCQLSLQDLEDFLEQESPASEDSSSSSTSTSSSSASRSSDSCRVEVGPPPPTSVRQNGHSRNSGCSRTTVRGTWSEGPLHQPQANGLMVPPARKTVPHRNAVGPECFILLTQDAWGSFSSEGQLDMDSRTQSRPLRKVARLPPPRPVAPLSPQPVPRQGHLAVIPDVEGLGPDTDGSMEHRSSSVPLESREHTWLVKIAMGSWPQVQALLREDPHLATRKDFVSGYTVLHWLAKHGNAQVLQEVISSVRRAGVALDVNAKSGCGYTPLHLAAIHGHQLVIKVLVQKLRCLIQVRDSSGKKPWQYLSSTTTGEVWQLLGAPRDKTIFPARPITRTASASSTLARNGKSPQLARKISRKTSLAAYLKPQHIKRKMSSKYPPLQEREEYSD